MWRNKITTMSNSPQVLVLAAGEGKRLKPLTIDKPKTLLSVYKDNVILDIIIKSFLEADFKNFVFVVGYKGEMIERYIREKYLTQMEECVFIENREYATTNNSYSLFLGLKYIKGDFVLIDSDIVFEKKVLEKLLAADYENKLVARYTEKPNSEEMKILLDKNGFVLDISKNIPLDKTNYESIGIEYFSYKWKKMLYSEMEQDIDKYSDRFYEYYFNRVIKYGYFLHIVEVKEEFCIEIDFKEDLEQARKEIYKAPWKFAVN